MTDDDCQGWTTRRYARSLSEAFADERARSVERYRVPSFDRWAGRVLAIFIGCALAALLLHGLGALWLQ